MGDLTEIQAKYANAGWQEVYERDGPWHRDTSIRKGVFICEVCNEDKIVLEIDTSDGEYNSFTCCALCFIKLLGVEVVKDQK